MTSKEINKKISWDFRGSQELLMSNSYETNGFVVENANEQYLNLLKSDLEDAYLEFTQIHCKQQTSLEEAHRVMSHSENNELRLYIMQSFLKTQVSTKTIIILQKK